MTRLIAVNKFINDDGVCREVCQDKIQIIDALVCLVLILLLAKDFNLVQGRSDVPSRLETVDDGDSPLPHPPVHELLLEPGLGEGV